MSLYHYFSRLGRLCPRPSAAEAKRSISVRRAREKNHWFPGYNFGVMPKLFLHGHSLEDGNTFSEHNSFYLGEQTRVFLTEKVFKHRLLHLIDDTKVDDFI